MVGFYAAYVLGRFGDFTAPSALSQWLEEAPGGEECRSRPLFSTWRLFEPLAQRAGRSKVADATKYIRRVKTRPLLVSLSSKRNLLVIMMSRASMI